MLMVPDSGVRAARGQDGQVLRNPNGRPVMVQDHYRDLRVNWPSYLCYVAAASSFAWTLFLVGYGIVAWLGRKPQPGAAPKGGLARPVGNTGETNRPPSVN